MKPAFIDWNGTRVRTCFQVAKDQDATKGPASVDKSLDKCLGAESWLQPVAKPKSEPGWLLVDQSLVKERKEESFTLTLFFTLDGRGPDKC